MRLPNLAGAARVARLTAIESAPPFVVLATVAAAAALASYARSGEVEAGGRAAAAVAVAIGLAEVATLATAALVGALVLPRDLATGRVQPLLARPISRGAYLAGAAGGATAAALLAGLPPLALVLVAVRGGAYGEGAAARVSPRAVATATAHAPDVESATLVGSRNPRLDWRFEALGPLRGRSAARLVFRPLYVLSDGLPGEAAALIRLQALDAGGNVLEEQVVETALAHRRRTEVAVPERFLAGRVARLDASLGVGVGAAVSFDLRRDAFGQERAGAGLEARGAPLEAGLGLALFSLLVQAGTVATLAVLASTFLSEWVAAILALALAAAARSLDTIGAFADALRAAAHTHGHGGEVHPAAHAPGPAWLTGAADAAGRALARVLPDLARLDVAGPVADGRLATPDGGALAHAVVAAAAALAFGWLVFSRRDIHGGGRG